MNVALRRALRTSLGASAAILALNVGTGVALARTLGPHDRGDLAVVLLWPSVLTAVAAFGLSDATTYHAARKLVGLGSLVGTVFVLALVQGLVVVLAGAAVIPLALHNYDRDTVHAAYAFLAFAPLNLLTLASMSVLNGLRRYAAFQALRVATILLITVPVGVLALTGALTVGRTVAVYLGANLLVAITAAVCARRACDEALVVERATARRVLAFGIRSHAGSMSSLLNERLDQLLVSAFLAPVQLGLYVIAVTATSVTSLVGLSVSPVAAAQIAHLDRDEARATARRLIAFTFWASLAATLPIIVFAAPLIRLFFGDAFASVAHVAQLLLVAAVFLSTNRTLTAVLNGLGRPLEAGIAEGAAVACTLVLLAVLLPTMGLIGAGIASVAAYGVTTVLMTLPGEHHPRRPSAHALPAAREACAPHRSLAAEHAVGGGHVSRAMDLVQPARSSHTADALRLGGGILGSAAIAIAFGAAAAGDHALPISGSRS